jgi:small subunit ribosomal protein S19
MTRSVWKGPFVDKALLTRPTASQKRVLSEVLVKSRRSCILPEHVGQRVSVYNGRSFLSLRIKEDMVGRKFGEFASTRFHKQKHGTKGKSNRR